MMSKRHCGIKWALVLLATLALMGLSGCGYFQSSGKKSSATEPPPSEQGPAPIYYDFGDVLVPSELKVEPKKSFIYRTPGFSAGVLSLKGRVDGPSLIAFFERNMAKDNWKPISSFKSVRTFMLFQKENRWCAININEADFTTFVEIWVSPTIAEGGGSLFQ